MVPLSPSPSATSDRAIMASTAGEALTSSPAPAPQRATSLAPQRATSAPLRATSASQHTTTPPSGEHSRSSDLRVPHVPPTRVCVPRQAWRAVPATKKDTTIAAQGRGGLLPWTGRQRSSGSRGTLRGRVEKHVPGMGAYLPPQGGGRRPVAAACAVAGRAGLGRRSRPPPAHRAHTCPVA